MAGTEALELDVGLDGVRLRALHVVLGKYVLHALNAYGYGLGVVRRAVLPQQVLQHVARHGGVARDLLDKVFAYHVAREVVVELLVEVVHLCAHLPVFFKV